MAVRACRFGGILLLMLGLAGCAAEGLKRVPVKGKLTAKGQPVDHASVIFLPMSGGLGLGGTGGSDTDGSFTVQSSTQDRKYVPGLVPGEYKVRVSRMVTKDGKPLTDGATEADNPGSKETVPLKYATEDSPLRVTVPESGEVTVDIPEPLVKGGVMRTRR
jgi:hypothetical protein